MNGVRLYMHPFNSGFRFWMFLTMFKHSKGGDIFSCFDLGNSVLNTHFFENYRQFSSSLMQSNETIERVLAVFDFVWTKMFCHTELKC